MKELYKIFEADKEEISAYERLVLVVIHTYSKNGPIDFSYEELASHTGLSKRMCFNVVKSLMEKDLLRLEKSQKGKSNVYILNM